MPSERRNSNARTSLKLPKCHPVISFHHIFPRIRKLILGLHHSPQGGQNSPSNCHHQTYPHNREQDA
ncbi:hypothetical protein Scep_024652 [Stephania cephalantha]|uniref:Uncharacterized protein n=1 Tax=Stephania cephalantha TaxID=152367 RepID=A0AAP0F2I3_9MAGN